jgi:hypothetical protein
MQVDTCRSDLHSSTARQHGLCVGCCCRHNWFSRSAHDLSGSLGLLMIWILILWGNTYRQVRPNHQLPEEVELRAAAAASWVEQLHSITFAKKTQEGRQCHTRDMRRNWHQNAAVCRQYHSQSNVELACRQYLMLSSRGPTCSWQNCSLAKHAAVGSWQKSATVCRRASCGEEIHGQNETT